MGTAVGGGVGFRGGLGGLEDGASVPIHVDADGVAVFYTAGDYLFAQRRSYELVYGTAQGTGAEARVAALEGYAPYGGVGKGQVDVLFAGGFAEVVEEEAGYLGELVVAKRV